MSATYFIGVDQAAGEDVGAISFCEFRDGKVMVLSCTTDRAEIATLLADTDHVEPPS